MKRHPSEQSKYDHPTCPDYMAESFRENALRVAKAVGLKAGIYVLNDCFSRWPDMLEGEIDRLKKSLEG